MNRLRYSRQFRPFWEHAATRFDKRTLILPFSAGLAWLTFGIVYQNAVLIALGVGFILCVGLFTFVAIYHDAQEGHYLAERNRHAEQMLDGI